MLLKSISAIGSWLGLILIDKNILSVNSASGIERLSLEGLILCLLNEKVKNTLRNSQPEYLTDLKV